MGLKQAISVWDGLIPFMIETSCDLLWTRWWTFVFREVQGIWELAQQLLSSQEEHRSTCNFCVRTSLSWLALNRFPYAVYFRYWLQVLPIPPPQLNFLVYLRIAVRTLQTCTWCGGKMIMDSISCFQVRAWGTVSWITIDQRMQRKPSTRWTASDYRTRR